MVRVGRCGPILRNPAELSSRAGLCRLAPRLAHHKTCFAGWLRGTIVDMRIHEIVVLCLASTLLANCSGGAKTAEDFDAASVDATDDARPLDSATPADATVPPQPWQYLATPGAQCANGTETGFGLSLAPSSDTAVLFLQGGGACWESGACYFLKAASHFEETVQGPTVMNEVASPAMARLFDRSNPDNPFPTATMMYVPYCTGDLHAGTKVHTYDYFGPKIAHHVGGLNMDAYLAKMKPLLPNVKRVILMGISAGGFGASLTWWRVRAAFGPTVRVDVIDDCGPMMNVLGDGRWGTMKAAWGLALPPDCADCGDGLSKWMPYYATHVAAPDRYAVMAYRGDDVIGTFFGLSDAIQASQITALRAAAGPRQKFFTQDGNPHVMFGQTPWPTAGGVSLGTWIHQFLVDDPAWTHQGP